MKSLSREDSTDSFEHEHWFVAIRHRLEGTNSVNTQEFRFFSHSMEISIAEKKTSLILIVLMYYVFSEWILQHIF